MIAAIELGSIWMLGWLAAAGIPIALHLLHRRRQQEVRWAAMELLLHAIQQNSRTLRIEGWLLLLLRTLALILFALALARPLLVNTGSAANNSDEPPRLWVIVLDSSYSMNYTSGRQSLWQQAQSSALELVSQAQPGDAFLLVQLADPAQSIISQPAFDTQRVTAEIQRLKCTDGGSDVSSCLQVLRQLLEDAKPTISDVSQVHIVFYTDMGQDGWQPATRDPLKRELEELSTRYHVRVESLAPETPQNLAITALEADAAVAIKGKPLRCSATVHNYSTVAVTRVPVQFQTGGATRQTEFVDCPPGQSRSVFVELQPTDDSTWAITAALPDDRLNVDNQRTLVVAVKPQIQIVTVEETSGSAKLINLSLAPATSDARASAGSRALKVDTWSSFDLQTRSLSDVGVVILCDPSDVSSASLAKLKNFVEGGGSVWVLAGPRTSAAAWNQSDLSLSQLTGIKLQEPSQSGDWRIDPLNYVSPIAKPFANYLDAGLLTTPIFRYWKVVPLELDSNKVITDLALEGGDPLLIRRTLGDGWIAVMLSAPQSGANVASEGDIWNAMATWPSFVPIMHKTVETLVGGSEGSMNLLVGEPLRGSTALTSQSLELVVRRPDNTQNRLTVAMAPTSGRRTWLYAATDRAGIYEATLQDSEATPTTATTSAANDARRFAVNIVPDQSDMLSLNTNALSLKSGPESSSGARTGTSLDQRQPSERLAHLCLWALLVTLVSESLLAWHLGRRLSS